jgi:hypothetical protein
VPQQTTVSQRGVRGAAKFVITSFLLMFIHEVLQNCHFKPIMGAAEFFKDLNGATNQNG